MALARVSELEQVSSRALLGKRAPSEGLALLLPALEQGLPQIFQTKNYRSEVRSASSLRSLLKESAWQALQELLGFNELSRLQSLACGSFESGVVGDILAWAEGLPSQHLALQLALYEVVENKGGEFSSRAGELRQIALGGGSLKQRLQYNLAHFQEHAMNPATVGGLAAGMWLGAGVRYLSLSRLSQVKGFFSANALGGQALARGVAFLSEVPGVVLAGKGIRQLRVGTQDWSLNTLTGETARLGLSLLVIKGIAGVAHRGLAMGGAMQAEAAAGSGLLTRIARATVPHGATGVGIYLAKPAEKFVFGGLGLGVGDSGMDAVFETLSFGVAGSLSRAALSPRMNIRLAQWQRRSYEMERGLAQGVLNRLRSSGSQGSPGDFGVGSMYQPAWVGAGAKGFHFNGGELSTIQKFFGKGSLNAYQYGKSQYTGDDTKPIPSLKRPSALSIRGREAEQLWGDIEAYVVNTKVPNPLLESYRRLFEDVDWQAIASTDRYVDIKYPQLHAARETAFHFYHAWRVNAHQNGFGTYFDALLQQASIVLLTNANAEGFGASGKFNALVKCLSTSLLDGGPLKAIESWFYENFGERLQFPQSEDGDTAPHLIISLEEEEAFLIERHVFPYLKLFSGKVPEILGAKWCYLAGVNHWEAYNSRNVGKIYRHFLKLAQAEERALFFQALKHAGQSKVPVLFLDRLTKVLATRSSAAPSLFQAKLHDMSRMNGGSSLLKGIINIRNFYDQDHLDLGIKRSLSDGEIINASQWRSGEPITSEMINRVLALDETGLGVKVSRALKRPSRLWLELVNEQVMQENWNGQGQLPHSLIIYDQRGPNRILLLHTTEPVDHREVAGYLLDLSSRVIHEYVHHKYDLDPFQPGSEQLWASEARAILAQEGFQHRMGTGAMDLLYAHPGGPAFYLLGAIESSYFILPKFVVSPKQMDS